MKEDTKNRIHENRVVWVGIGLGLCAWPRRDLADVSMRRYLNLL